MLFSSKSNYSISLMSLYLIDNNVISGERPKSGKSEHAYCKSEIEIDVNQDMHTNSNFPTTK